MKYLLIICSLILLTQCIQIKKEKGSVIVGESTNDINSEPTDAITHAAGGNLRGVATPFDNGFSEPEYINEIRPIEQLDNRVIGTAEEIPTVINFYDGSQKLNKIDVNCKIYTTPNECYLQSYCGWCGQTAGCIRGSSGGPLEECEIGTYNFNLL